MATPSTTLVRPLFRTPRRFTPLRHTQQRTFLPNLAAQFNPLGASTPQTLSAHRTLPYPSAAIYTIISDVSSYSTFLPYCQSSSVTRWSAPDSTYQRRWPSEANLVVGYGNVSESFTSRVFCVPGRILESVGGGAETALDRREIAHHVHEGEGKIKSSEGGLLTHLSSRWTIEHVSDEKTEVTLALEFAFANPLYTALSVGAAPKVADTLIKAFEERVRTLLDSNPDMASASLQQLGEGEARR
ncbi:dehydrase and lipid transport-domain-containing protein [Massariosphaeria phaeospora]|uniref:Dehydrase and lipid transport-domain-containing protein n=1 Tax=Massariosphaeria phaeospora TaxID=100035 RepID=A0A7C8ICW4_9PLEO|nr:dehydrase and lipid transport-domain-containing protein [Massariosphaeria phaeospora]